MAKPVNLAELIDVRIKDAGFDDGKLPLVRREPTVNVSKEGVSTSMDRPYWGFDIQITNMTGQALNWVRVEAVTVLSSGKWLNPTYEFYRSPISIDYRMEANDSCTHRRMVTTGPSGGFGHRTFYSGMPKVLGTGAYLVYCEAEDGSKWWRRNCEEIFFGKDEMVDYANSSANHGRTVPSILRSKPLRKNIP